MFFCIPDPSVFSILNFTAQFVYVEQKARPKRRFSRTENSVPKSYERKY